MKKYKILPTAFVATILMFTLSNFYIPNALAPTTTANPRIVYWADPQLVNGTGQSWWFFPNPNAYHIMWSPSGRMLLLVVSEMDVYGPFYMTKVVVINASSMEVIHKFSAPGAICSQTESSFAISSDETKIFFGNSSSDRNFVDIVSVDLDGSNPTVIT
ncbi:MAG: hypothetical protein QXN95_03985, partial [Candidatus Bathyarchaeia archaeon]